MTREHGRCEFVWGKSVADPGFFTTRIRSLREGNVFSHVCMCVQRWGSHVTTTQDAIDQSQDTWRNPPSPTRPVQTCLLGATPWAWLSPYHMDTWVPPP